MFTGGVDEGVFEFIRLEVRWEATLGIASENKIQTARSL